MFSAGTALSAPGMSRADLLKSLVTFGSRPDLGFLGFLRGENKYTYPRWSGEKLDAFFSLLSESADYVVADCGERLCDPLAGAAVRASDRILRLYSPDPSSFGYFASQLPLYSDPSYRLGEHIQALNVPDGDLFMPVEEAGARMEDVRLYFPYSAEVKRQTLDGRLCAGVRDRKFRAAVRAAADMTV